MKTHKPDSHSLSVTESGFEAVPVIQNSDGTITVKSATYRFSAKPDITVLELIQALVLKIEYTEEFYLRLPEAARRHFEKVEHV